MSPEHRQMWADLYRYFEQVMQTDPADKQRWQEVVAKGTSLWRQYGEDAFVREVACASLGYRMMQEDK